MRIAREILNEWHADADVFPLTSNLIPQRDYSGLNKQDCELRIWLPDPARQAMAEICGRMKVTMTVYLTEFFATYLYGIHEVMRMRNETTGLYEPKAIQPGDMRDATIMVEAPDELGLEYDDPVPEMGKNIFALKIFLPSKIKDGLQHRANQSKVPLGRFTRAMICAHLFGRDVGPMRLLNQSSSGSSIT